MIGGFRFILSDSVFHGSLIFDVIMINDSKNVIVNWVLNFTVRVIERRNKVYIYIYLGISQKPIQRHCEGPHIGAQINEKQK